MTNEPRLAIELVPSTSWYNNLRRVLPKPVWDKLRRRTYGEYGYRCGICGAEGRLNCHEVWKYDDQHHVQKLAGFIALCDLCHHAKHIGLAGILASEGKVDYGRVVAHFMEVNGCDRAAFEEHRKKAFNQWSDRSQHEWKVELGKYENVVGSRRKRL